MYARRLLYLYLLLISCQTAQGQADSSGGAPPDLDAYFQDDAQEGHDQALLDWLVERTADPLPINAASATELAQLPMLSAPLARRIVNHRTRHGPFRSLDDLDAVTGLTPSVLEEIRPFVTTDLPPRRPMRVEWLQRIDPGLDRGPDYDRGRFAGSPLKLYSRLRIRRAQHFQLGIAADKDAGESFTWDPHSRTYFYDHVTAHLAFIEAGPVQQLILGDYTLGFGQGLTLQRQSHFRSTRNPVRALQTSGTGMRPFASRSEYGFFRGAAVSFAPGASWRVRAFVSRRHLDGTPVDTTSRSGIRRILTSGYHRTTTERARKGTVTESLAGTSVTYVRPSAAVGVTAYHSVYDPPLVPDTSPPRYFAPAGAHFTVAGLHGQASLGSIDLFGEAAMGIGRAPSAALGLVYHVTRAATWGMHIRHYAPDGPALHGTAFGTSGTPVNESGIYSAIELQPAVRWNLTAFFDQYRHPWLRATAPRPTTAYDAGITLDHEPRPWLTYYVQLRHRTREEAATAHNPQGRATSAVTPAVRRTLRLHAEYVFSKRLLMRMRLEGVWAAVNAADVDKGMLLYQDLRWQISRPIEAAVRLTFFDTDSWAARVYAFENDVRYSFSVPALYGMGQRTYLFLRWRPVDNLIIEGRYGTFDYEDQSRPTAPEDLLRRDLHLQVQYAF